MDVYAIIKTAHIISAAILFGTGVGIAFFMFMSRYSMPMAEKLFAAKITVLADCVFILPAVILQPLTGAWLVWQGGFEFLDTWLVITYGLYILAGICWLPVVWLQIQMKNMIISAHATNASLPARYNRFFQWWAMLGVPAFLGLICVFYLMVTKPT